MIPQDDKLALRLALLLADWRFLRREQIALLLHIEGADLDRLLATLAEGEIIQAVAPAYHRPEQTVYALGRGGAALVAAQLGSDRAGLVRRPRRSGVGLLFLEHLLAINDVRLAFLRAAECHQGHRLLTWRQGGDIADRVPSPGRPGVWLPVRPDGYLAYQAATRRVDAFVEADLGTVTNKRWASRIQAYVAYRLSGRFPARYGVLSFRVLTVTTTERRLANLWHTTQKAGGRGLFWFTTFAELGRHSPLAPIWSVAGAGTAGSLSAASPSSSKARRTGASAAERCACRAGQRGGR